MTHRIVIGVEQDLRGNIIALYGDEDAGWSPISRHEAVESMRASMHTYATAGRRGGADIHIFNSDWLRTVKDVTSEDNLDNLGGPDYTRLGAGAYGIAVTLSPDGVTALARELHASGAVVDRVSLLHDGLLVTAMLGVPRFEPGADASHFEIVRDAICHVRRIDDATDPGTNAVATVTAACAVSTQVDATAGWAGFTLTYSVPERGAVRVETAGAAPARAAVTESLTGWVAGSRVDRWDLPIEGLIAGASRVDAGMAGSGHAQVGFRFDGRREGAFPAARQGYDWTVALSRPYVVERIGAAIRASLGGLPAPMGDDWRVPITSDVSLNYLDVALIPGAVQISGAAVSGVPVPVTAHFTASFTLALDADGLVQATLGDTDVEIVEWYAHVANFLSGGNLVRGVEAGLRGALGALGADAASGLLGPDLLTRMVAAGTSNVATVRAVPRRVWIEPGALRLGGDFERSPAAPTLTPVRLGDRVDLTLSSTPGATVREIRWDVGGVSHIQAFEHRAMSWTPPAGRASATVTVTTDEGQTATQTV